MSPIDISYKVSDGVWVYQNVWEWGELSSQGLEYNLTCYEVVRVFEKKVGNGFVNLWAI